MKKPLTVGDLRKILLNLGTADIPDSAPVVRRAEDGEIYRQVSFVEDTTALDQGNGIFKEDLSEDVTPESEHGERVAVLMII